MWITAAHSAFDFFLEYEGCSLILVTCLIIFFCGQSMGMLFICCKSPIFSDQTGIKIIAV